MDNRKRLIISVTMLFVLNAFIIGLFQSMPQAVATYKQNSRGAVVRQIQTKLKYLGFYKGTVDGVYGSKTTAAVKALQRDRGLKPDGVAGPRTLATLGIKTGSSGGGSSGVGRQSNDLYLLARIISAEARAEPYTGQVAVGAVILNRVKHPSFPKTIAGVIYQPGAFTAITDGQINQPVEDISKRAAQDALNGVNPIDAAIYYYNPSTATNQWIRSRQVVKTIGKHIFCK